MERSEKQSSIPEGMDISDTKRHDFATAYTLNSNGGERKGPVRAQLPSDDSDVPTEIRRPIARRTRPRRPDLTALFDSSSLSERIGVHHAMA